MRVHSNGRGSRPYSALVNERNRVTLRPLHTRDEEPDNPDERGNVVGVAVIAMIAVAVIGLVIIALWWLHR